MSHQPDDSLRPQGVPLFTNHTQSECTNEQWAELTAGLKVLGNNHDTAVLEENTLINPRHIEEMGHAYTKSRFARLLQRLTGKRQFWWITNVAVKGRTYMLFVDREGDLFQQIRSMRNNEIYYHWVSDRLHAGLTADTADQLIAVVTEQNAMAAVARAIPRA